MLCLQTEVDMLYYNAPGLLITACTQRQEQTGIKARQDLHYHGTYLPPSLHYCRVS
jgi:hypothetical protein